MPSWRDGTRGVVPSGPLAGAHQGGHMKKLRSKGALLAGVLVITAVVATACPVPAPAPATAANWGFKATQVTVNEGQDEAYTDFPCPVGRQCTSLEGCQD